MNYRKELEISRFCIVKLRAYACMGMLLFAGSTLADDKVSADSFSLPVFQSTFSKISQDDGDALTEYENLQSIYGKLEGMDKKQAAQLLSMADAMFGRYQDAQDRYYTAFPKGKKPAACPASGVTPQPALEGLRELSADAQVVLINESHSVVITRAFIYRLLPILHDMGFKYLAMEALAPVSNELAPTQSMKVLRDIALPTRGYPLDKSAGGFYLREPIYAEIVREALAQGFTLVAYEVLQAGSRDDREEGQATALAKLIEAEPNAKLAVIAGYSHIWKSDGWMADRLQKLVAGKLLSIDQTSGLWGCENAPGPGTLEPYILIDKDGQGWTAKPERVDVTVIRRPRKDGRSAPSGWLTLGGSREGVQLDTTACVGDWPCLISAFYVSEVEGAVPADRVLLEGANDKAMLFLKPGKYRYAVEPSSRPRSESELVVP